MAGQMPNDPNLYQEIGYIRGTLEELLRKFDASERRGAAVETKSDESRRRLYERVDEGTRAIVDLGARLKNVEARVDDLEPFAESFKSFKQRWVVYLSVFGAAWVIVGGVLVAVLTAYFTRWLGI